MQIEELEIKVKSLREGSVLVTPEERREVQAAYDHKLGLWRRRKKIYQELWGMITESMTENLKDLKVIRLSFSTQYMSIYIMGIESFLGSITYNSIISSVWLTYFELKHFKHSKLQCVEDSRIWSADLVFRWHGVLLYYSDLYIRIQTDLRDSPQEEIGIETDEDVGCNISDYINLGAKKQKKWFQAWLRFTPNLFMKDQWHRRMKSSFIELPQRRQVDRAEDVGMKEAPTDGCQ